VKCSVDQYRGCLLGLAFGDALGAPYEGGWLERAAWRLLGKTKGRMRYTDDTQMSLDLIHSKMEHGAVQQDRLASQFASSYRWSRGYGPGAAKLLKRIRRGADWRQANRSQFSDGSYGNGAAMRSAVLALFYAEQHALRVAVEQASEITHAHPEAIEGAQLIALATSLSLHKESIDEILPVLQEACDLQVFKDQLMQMTSLFYDGKFSFPVITSRFGNGMAARRSCVSAIGFALLFRDQPYTDMLKAIRQGGGDVDTIGAMAGAIWGARNGFSAITGVSLKTIESGEAMLALADQAYYSVVQT
jgi:poly(ADP-ribose) glycohydrolase ARH3